MRRAVAAVGRRRARAACSPDAASDASDGSAVANVSIQDDDGLHGVVLPKPYDVPDVTLTDAAGKPYDLPADATKPLTLVFFGYTHCPDICQVVMANIASSLTRLDADQRAKVRDGVRHHRPGARRRAHAALLRATGSTRPSTG